MDDRLPDDRKRQLIQIYDVVYYRTRNDGTGQHYANITSLSGIGYSDFVWLEKHGYIHAVGLHKWGKYMGTSEIYITKKGRDIVEKITQEPTNDTD